jgi:ficolin
MQHHNASYNKILMDYFFCGDLFSVMQHHNVSYSAILNKGGWWYNKCHSANLNGLYLNGTYAKYAFGMTWFYWKKHQYSFRE